MHAKLTLIDDAFANIGSANIFSRSMFGTDSEMSAAVATSTSLVRDLRVAVWGEHLRAPMKAALRASLEDLDLALGIWRPDWLPDGVAPSTWLVPGSPEGFEPSERVLFLVGPPERSVGLGRGVEGLEYRDHLGEPGDREDPLDRG